jgi:hypothetical protein
VKRKKRARLYVVEYRAMLQKDWTPQEDAAFKVKSVANWRKHDSQEQWPWRDWRVSTYERVGGGAVGRGR